MKKTGFLLAAVLLISGLMASCQPSGLEKNYTQEQLDKASIQILKADYLKKNSPVLIKKQEGSLGVFFFYKIGTDIVAMNFEKQDGGTFKPGLRSIGTSSGSGVSEGSTAYNNIFTYILYGRMPAEKKECIVTIEYPEGGGSKTVRVPIDSPDGYFYFGYQDNIGNNAHASYEFQ